MRKKAKLKNYTTWRRVDHVARCLLGLTFAIPLYAVWGFFRSFGAMVFYDHYNLSDLWEELGALYPAAWSMLQVGLTGYATAKQARDIYSTFPKKITWDEPDDDQPEGQEVER